MRRKSSLLWGAVGALAFLALTQAYVLVGGNMPLTLLVRAVLALALGVLVAGVTYVTEHRLTRKGRT